jgi:hypothetical protein
MSARTDEEYARQYEEDKQWYEEFQKWYAKLKASPTSMQLYTIDQIEERNKSINLKFTGRTSEDASEFISHYGNKRYNENSSLNHLNKEERDFQYPFVIKNSWST